MKKKSLFLFILLMMVGLGVLLARGLAPRRVFAQHDVSMTAVSALDTAFTYQGTLEDKGSPANGAYDFQFVLYDALSGGSHVGTTQVIDDLLVDNGYFTALLDFGDVFDGTALWLEISVRPGASTGSYTMLSPRQALTAVPYALFAKGGAWGCPDGQAIKEIQPDGTVVCQQDAPLIRNIAADETISKTLVSPNNTGTFSSVSIGADGLGLIAFYNSTSTELQLAHCADVACTQATISRVDITENVGKYASLTIGAETQDTTHLSQLGMTVWG